MGERVQIKVFTRLVLVPKCSDSMTAFQYNNRPLEEEHRCLLRVRREAGSS